MDNLAVFIIGFIVGSGVTILLGMCIRYLVKIAEKKDQVKKIKSQYFHYGDDGKIISFEDDDGEQ